MADRSRMMNFHSSILKVASLIKNNEQSKAEDNFEMEKKKRERKANYSRDEINRLVTLILPKKDIVENKKNGADQWQEKKQAWEDIERAFNRKCDRANYRDSKCLKIKYESLKRDIKKKWACIIANKRNSDGKLPKFTDAEKKIKDILTLPMEGYCDFEILDEKSEGDDNYSTASSNSDYNTNYHEMNKTKVEKQFSEDEEETINFEADDLILDCQSMSVEGPPKKRMREDPLIAKDQHQSKSVENTHYNTNLEEEKLKLQVEMLKEELEIKKIQRKLLEEEFAHKKVMHELEKQHLLVKIETLNNTN